MSFSLLMDAKWLEKVYSNDLSLYSIVRIKYPILNPILQFRLIKINLIDSSCMVDTKYILLN